MARSKIRRLKDTLDRYSEALHASRRRGAELIACADKLGRRVDSLEYGNAKLEEEIRLAKEALAKADDYIKELEAEVAELRADAMERLKASRFVEQRADGVWVANAAGKRTLELLRLKPLE